MITKKRNPIIQVLSRAYIDIKQTCMAHQKFMKTNEEQEGCVYPFYNFWTDQTADSMWLSRFVRTRGLAEGSNKKLAFFSVYGPRQIIEFDKSDVRVFFTGENLKASIHRSQYADSFLGDERIDLSLGFEYFNDQRYMRFPLWVMYLFPPEATMEDIRAIIHGLNEPPTEKRNRFASLVASWDPCGLRREMVDAISPIDPVSCPGRWNHNDDNLVKEFGDVKMDYLKAFRFNLCPENTNAMGYTTEKLIQALAANCVPIYWGSFNQPELGILNQNAILFWNAGGDNTSVLKQIKELNENEILYREFVSQPRFTEEATDKVIDMFDQLDNRLRELLS